jgi:hypothetical protein
MVVRASSLFIHAHTDDVDVVNLHVVELGARGQSNTSTDAIIKHALMNTNPASNDPVR